MRNSLIKSVLAGLCMIGMVSAAQADMLLDSTSLVGLATVAPASEWAFTTTVAEALTVTLTDFQNPAAFATLQIAVTLGDTLVGSVNVDPTSHKATLAIPAQIGNYKLHVVGLPVVANAQSTAAYGNFGACVTRNLDATPRTCIAADSFANALLTPVAASTTPSTPLQANFTSTVAGNYTVTITDDLFPTALVSVAGAIFKGSSQISTVFSLGVNQVTLDAGVIYTLGLGALADANVQAGLYSVHIADPTGAAVFDQTLSVGKLAPATVVNNPAPQVLDLKLTDLMYPAAFSNLGVAVTSGSALLVKLGITGSAATAAAVPAGNVQIWQYLVTSGMPGVYSVTLANATGSSSLFTTTQVVNPNASAGSTSYAFVANLTAAGTYNVLVSDFQFPAALAAAPTVTVAQNGVLLNRSSSGAFTATAGDVVALVTAVPPASGSGLFGITVGTTGSMPQLILDRTQSVGAVFTSQTITVSSAGSYDVKLTDLGFPANFQSLAVVLSQGSLVLGKAYGGGAFSFAGTAGTYVLTFVDTPSSTAVAVSGSGGSATGTAGYGLYSINVASSAPTLTFTSSAASVAANGTVTLTWASANATACTASGSTAWSGTEALSGSASVVIPATAALTLACSGSGGSASQSVNVTATVAAASGHSGGGRLEPGLLAGLAALVLATRCRRARSEGAPTTEWL